MKLDPEALEAFTAEDTFVAEHFRPGLIRYLESGIPTGSFLEAVLTNDLKNAIAKAHPALSWRDLRGLVKWLYNFAPLNAWGDEAKVRGWKEARQLERMESA